MAISKTVLPISDVKVGIKAEDGGGNGFGAGIDASGNDGTAYRQLNLVQATKPTFNIMRESRLLSGRGLVKHASDTIINTRGGTVTMPFEMLATPKLLAQHLALTCQEHSESGSYKHLFEIGGQGSPQSAIGGTESDNIPHTVNLAYYPAAAEGIKVTGVMCSDLTLNLEAGSFMSMSGNYFSGFSNPVSTGSCLEQTFDGSWVAPETAYFNANDISTKTLTSDDGANQDLIMKNFSITIANGVNRVGSNTNGDAEIYACPEYNVTGSITVKYDANFDYGATRNVIQDFLDGDTLPLNIKIGDGTLSSVGEANIFANIQYTGDPGQDISENGIFHTFEFECLQTGASDTNEAFQIELFNGESQSAW